MITTQICWSDTSYQKLENGIRDLVRSLHSLGIKTIMSCEGHIRTAGYYTGVLPWPWIIIAVEPEQMTTLQQKLNIWNELNPRKRWILSIERIHGPFTSEYVSEMIRREFPGCQVRALVPEDENAALDADILIATQTQTGDLANFLQKPS